MQSFISFPGPQISLHAWILNAKFWCKFNAHLKIAIMLLINTYRNEAGDVVGAIPLKVWVVSYIL